MRAITKKVKNQLPASTSQRSQPALPGIGTGHVPLMLPPIKKDRWVKQVQLVRWRAGRSSFMNRLAELERILANSVVMTGESKQFDSELRSYSFRPVSNMFLTGSRGKNLETQETVVLQIWQKKTQKNCYIWLCSAPNFSSIVRQCKWPFLSRKIVEFQKFCYHGNATSHFPFPLLSVIPFVLFRLSLFFRLRFKTSDWHPNFIELYKTAPS